MAKLSKKELEAKKKYHKKRTEFYSKKIKEVEQNEKRVGFRWYD